MTDTNFNLDHIEVEVNSTEKEKSGTVTSKEIAQNRGKPLSKYERNIVIFNWLHTLDEGAVIAHDHDHEEEYLQDE